MIVVTPVLVLVLVQRLVCIGANDRLVLYLAGGWQFGRPPVSRQVANGSPFSENNCISYTYIVNF